MAQKTIPAVSIVIPMYNSEKWIGECLDSILAQTFTNYEVIVVDDCSTDNSCKVVEGYLPWFNSNGDAKLQLIRSTKNSGSPGTPRNIGISLSRGEYIMFVDSDDALTKTALEEVYPIAKKFDVDVLHSEKCYRSTLSILTTDKRFLKEDVLILTDFVTTPTLMSDDLDERLQIFINHSFDWTTWQNMVRRDFIIRHGIKFPDSKVQVDTVFALFLLCLADKIVRIPNIFYVYRDREDSVCKPTLLSAEERVHRWGHSLLNSIIITEKFMNNIDFFKEHIEYKFIIFDALVRFICLPVCLSYSQVPAPQLDKFVRAEIAKLEGDTTALTAYLFARTNVCDASINQLHHHIRQQQEVIQQQQKIIQQLQAQLQQR